MQLWFLGEGEQNKGEKKIREESHLRYLMATFSLATRSRARITFPNPPWFMVVENERKLLRLKAGCGRMGPACYDNQSSHL